METTDHALDSTTTSLHHWLARAYSAKTVVESHVGEFHGLGDGENARFCFPIVLENSVDLLLDNITVIRSLLQQGAIEKTHFAVYFASSTRANDSLVNASQTITLRSHLVVRQIHCPDARDNSHLIDCAAEHCYADGYHYIFPAHLSYQLVGLNWAQTVALEMKVCLVGVFFLVDLSSSSTQSKGDLGVVEVGVTVGARVQPAMVLPRSHFKVFGVKLLPNISLGALSAFTRVVYHGESPYTDGSFYTSVRGSRARVLAAPNVPAEETLPASYDSTWAKALWHRYLCREKLWPRYCHEEDVKYYLGLPHHHAGKSLSREEYEMMEAAAKVINAQALRPFHFFLLLFFFFFFVDHFVVLGRIHCRSEQSTGGAEKSSRKTFGSKGSETSRKGRLSAPSS